MQGQHNTISLQSVLGFIGLGAMGSRMARNLLRAGYTLHAYDIQGDRVAAAAADGATAAAAAAAVVQAADVVMTSVPSSETFVQVAEEVLLPHARPGQIFIEFGTTTPPEIRRLAPLFAERGAPLLDVPVSGWITGAESGTLAMFIGGDEAVAARCRPLFEVLGDPDKTTYCGPSGAGQVVKGVNQLLSGLINGAYLEILAYAQNAGVDIATVRRAMGSQGARKQDLDMIAAQVEAGNGPAVGVKFRELPYFIQDAEEAGRELPLTRALYERCDQGERVVVDDNRPAPSYWHELTR